MEKCPLVTYLLTQYTVPVETRLLSGSQREKNSLLVLLALKRCHGSEGSKWNQLEVEQDHSEDMKQRKLGKVVWLNTLTLRCFLTQWRYVCLTHHDAPLLLEASALVTHLLLLWLDAYRDTLHKNILALPSGDNPTQILLMQSERPFNETFRLCQSLYNIITLKC